jgi:hypothetical protein
VYKDAKLLKKQINSRYANGIKSFSIETKLYTYSDINRIDANIYYLFPSSKKSIQKAVQKAQSNKAITFSYLKEYLEYGVMISIDVSKKIKPILNLTAIKDNNIMMRPILLDISTIYTKKEISI